MKAVAGDVGVVPILYKCSNKLGMLPKNTVIKSAMDIAVVRMTRALLRYYRDHVLIERRTKNVFYILHKTRDILIFYINIFINQVTQ